jgi:hypothetical protein
METQVTLIDREGKAKTIRMPLLPVAISIAELGLIPLLFMMLALDGVVLRCLAVFGVTDLAATIPFLRRQSDYLTQRGVDPASVVATFQVFALIVWLSAAILVLRLISGPFLFGYWNARAISLRKRYLPSSPESAVAAVLLIGLGGVWASTWAPMGAAPLLNVLLTQSPRAYLWLEAFVFVGSMIFSVEGILFGLLWLLKLTTSRLINPYEDQNVGTDK